MRKTKRLIEFRLKMQLPKGVEKQLEEIKGNARGRRETIVDLKSMGFENFTNYDTFVQDIRNEVIPTMEEVFPC